METEAIKPESVKSTQGWEQALSGEQATEEAPKEAPKEAPAEEKEAPKEAPEVEKPEPAAKQEAEASEVVEIEIGDDDKGDRKVPLKALKEERRKRQEAEDELRKTTRMILESQQAAQAQSADATESKEEIAYYDDPEGYVKKQLSQMDQRYQQRFVAISERNARARHKDYDDNFEGFKQAIESNPSLYDAVMASDDPGEAAYQEGKRYRMMERYGSDYETIVTKVRQEVADQYKKDHENEARRVAELKKNQPTSLGKVRSSTDKTVSRETQLHGWGDILSSKRS